MLDPYERVVYDYMGGIEDIRKAKVCMYFIKTVFPIFLSLSRIVRVFQLNFLYK